MIERTVIAGYDGTRSVIAAIPLFAMLSVFGTMCGVGSSLNGHEVRTRRWLGGLGRRR